MKILVIPLKFLLLYCFWSSFFFHVNAASETPCPPGCSCDNDGEWRCESNNLVRIPSPLPENITSLVLTSQNIPTIYRNDFSGVQRLLKIKINNCNVLNIENGTFENLTKLEELDLDSNRLTTIDVNLFRGLHSLRILELSHNEIERIENGTFTDLNKLEQLSIASNGMRSIAEGSFEPLTSLENLLLRWNELTHITAATLNGPQQLTEINLISYYLISFEIPSSFSQSLQVLNVNYNSRLSFPPCSLGNLSSLQHLSIDRTSVNFTLDLFVGDDCYGNQTIPPLTDLSIQNTNTELISVDLLSRFPDLQRFSCGDDDEDMYVEPGSLEVLQQLTYLRLYKLPPSFYQQSIVEPLPLLLVLWMDDLTAIPTPFITGISRILRDMYIYYPTFTELPSGAFGNVASMNFVSIVDSQIKAIDRNALQGVPNLSRLSFIRTQISFLPNGLFDNTPQLDSLVLNSDRLSCNCSMAWVVNFQETRQDVTLSGDCSSPAQLEGAPLSSLTDVDFDCVRIPTTQPTTAVLTADGTPRLSTRTKTKTTHPTTRPTASTVIHATTTGHLSSSTSYPTIITNQTWTKFSAYRPSYFTTKSLTEGSTISTETLNKVSTNMITTNGTKTQFHFFWIYIPVTIVVIITLAVTLVVVLIKARYFKKGADRNHRAGGENKIIHAYAINDNGRINDAFYDTIEDGSSAANYGLSSPWTNIPIQTSVPSTQNHHPHPKSIHHYQNNKINRPAPPYSY